MKGARIFLNRLLSTLREQCDSPVVIPSQGFYLDILWFLCFVKQCNGVVRFRRPSVFQEVFVDATLQAVGGVWRTRAYSEILPPELIGLSITLLEMYNILIA